MRQRYLRLISVLLLLAILTACGTDREGAAGGTVEGVVNRNGDFLVLLTDEGSTRPLNSEREWTQAHWRRETAYPSPIPESWARRTPRQRP
ncbi:hypothetical protein M5E87_17025 [Flavonifractor plautii]|nr:hypothetical protein M5E87_17025 [Flavonifractor plautii]